MFVPPRHSVKIRGYILGLRQKKEKDIPTHANVEEDKLFKLLGSG